VEPDEIVVSRQRLGKHIPAATNTVEELLEAAFSIRSTSYQMMYSENYVDD
jgi:hypothetical protein